MLFDIEEYALPNGLRAGDAIIEEFK